MLDSCVHINLRLVGLCWHADKLSSLAGNHNISTRDASLC